MNPSNYSTISFPLLGLELNPDRVLTLGPLTIHYYGVIIAAGLLLAKVMEYMQSAACVIS